MKKYIGLILALIVFIIANLINNLYFSVFSILFIWIAILYSRKK